MKVLELFSGTGSVGKVCKKLGIESVYGLGDKIQSSSWLTDGKQETQIR